MTIPEAARKLGVGRNQGYIAAHSGQIPTIKIGKRLLVPIAALENKLRNAGGSDRSGKAA
jgi:excisionase family DNA binding protein